jgi:hypothetical protein
LLSFLQFIRLEAKLIAIIIDPNLGSISSVAKIYEKLVTEQLEIYLETNHILAEQQAGFRKNHSTQTSLLNITNQWLMNTDKG